MSWHASLRSRYSGAFALFGLASFLGLLLHEVLDSELETFAAWSAGKPGAESKANTVTRVGNERRESHGQGATTDSTKDVGIPIAGVAALLQRKRSCYGNRPYVRCRGPGSETSE